MTKEVDLFVQSLIALCQREGGHQPVADKARVSGQNLWQIITARPLKSGRPRGVGPTLRAKLSAAYPDWVQRDGAPARAPYPEDVIMLAQLLDAVPQERRKRCFLAGGAAILLEAQSSEPRPQSAPAESPEKSPAKSHRRADPGKKAATRSSARA